MGGLYTLKMFLIYRFKIVLSMEVEFMKIQYYFQILRYRKEAHSNL